MEWLLAYLFLGLFTGIIAGLLGVGGGLVMVPALTWAFAYQGFAADYNIHLALGTSLAVIIPTSISSLRAHHAHGAVDGCLVRRITPGIVLGSLLGGGVAAFLPDRYLKLFFIAFLLYAATQMLLGFKPKPQRGLPGAAGMGLAGGIIGLISSWVGIGGGTLSVPFQIWCNVGMHRAIGTSAAIGLPIALAGMLGYVLSGHVATNLPAWSLGFVYLPAFLCIALGSGLTAPLGAKLTHRLPVSRLRRIFATLLYLLAARMIYGIWAA
ncbi:MAG TPA: sulfite exporter TauE/SafE family protein [Thiobacillaceae bacterium]|nr:sulfite exporter TauE/SafE family protein [Thiobacillaceae bacterium]HNU65352.1 sulfite exporter TauE/SafE family protein [Thiobacillaceae bacterium]